jgi:plasmid maintenance system killer protein
MVQAAVDQRHLRRAEFTAQFACQLQTASAATHDHDIATQACLLLDAKSGNNAGLMAI